MTPTGHDKATDSEKRCIILTLISLSLDVGLNLGTVHAAGESGPPAGTVSAGLSHTCGVEGAGTLDCWEDNTSGGATSALGTFVRPQVSAGEYHTCRVESDGTEPHASVRSKINRTGYGVSEAPAHAVARVAGGGRDEAIELLELEPHGRRERPWF